MLRPALTLPPTLPPTRTFTPKPGRHQVLRLRGGVAQLADKAAWDKAHAEAGDKLVVVDFTASWCATLTLTPKSRPKPNPEPRTLHPSLTLT